MTLGPCDVHVVVVESRMDLQVACGLGYIDELSTWDLQFISACFHLVEVWKFRILQSAAEMDDV